jgi:hypothetical protein
MDNWPSSFSKRYGYRSRPSGPLIYHEAPEQVRAGLLSVLERQMNKSPKWMRGVVCDVLRLRPDPHNWSEYPNIWGEVQDIVHQAKWYEVYDIMEAFAEKCARNGDLDEFSAHINELLADEGIGWRLNNTTALEIHGDAELENVLGDTEEELKQSGFATAASELAEARGDLSRRPDPDLSGAVHHAMASLECVAREVSGDPKKTLGEIIKQHQDLFPPPVDTAAAKLWGYASEQARHGLESRNLAWEEALLMVGVSGALCSYLNTKREDIQR